MPLIVSGPRSSSRDAHEREHVHEVQGLLGQALPQLRQLFECLPAASAAADADARFEHFCAHVWPHIKESSAKGAQRSLLSDIMSNLALLGTHCSVCPQLHQQVTSCMMHT